MPTQIKINSEKLPQQPVKSSEIPKNQFFFASRPVSVICQSANITARELFVRGGGSCPFIMSVENPGSHWLNLSDLAWPNYQAVDVVEITTR